jgi:hypothetical protein
VHERLDTSFNRHICFNTLGRVGIHAHLICVCFLNERLESLRQIVTRDVSRQSHAEITSSRTKWRRITLGASAFSKWQRTASRTYEVRSSRLAASVKIDSARARAV